MATRHTFCGSPDHAMDRRGFLGAAAGMAGLSALGLPALAAELKQQQKRVILLWLAGGASQLETWDPKPGAPTGGPFRSIQTSVPGVRSSELMPQMATRKNHTCLNRSLHTPHAATASPPQTI